MSHDSPRNDQLVAARRRLLLSLSVAGGALATGKMVPEKWVAPVVDSVLLPAHAQTTGELRQAASSGSDTIVSTTANHTDAIASSQGALDRVIASAIPTAHALEEVGGEFSAQVFGAEDSSGKWSFEVLIEELSYRQGDPAVFNTFIPDAHAATVEFTRQALYKSSLLAVGESQTLGFIAGCTFDDVEFKFQALNGDSPRVAVNGTKIDLFPGPKPFGAPVCDVD